MIMVLAGFFEFPFSASSGSSFLEVMLPATIFDFTLAFILVVKNVLLLGTGINGDLYF